jgi:hypothetical protein
MTSHTTIRSWRAMSVAGVILLGTCFVLFQDVLNGAAITTSHVLTALALLIATAAGHQIVPTFKAGRYALTLSMIVLALGSIAYVGLMSGARNAEVTATKAERIDGANTQRAALEAQRDGLAPERARSQGMLDAARKELAKECSTGKGSKCDGKRLTAEVYANAVAGIDAKVAAIDERIAALGAPQTPNAGYKAIAEGIVLLPWFTGHTVAEVERTLIVLLPWLAVLLAELSVPAFLSLALGHETRPAQAVTVAAPANDLEPGPGTPVAESRDPVIDWVRAFRARHGRLPQIPEVQDAHGLSRTTAWRRIKAA